MVVYQFDKDSQLNNWRIVNDGVMGGVSQSQLSINQEGNGVFEGYVSLENNGGFSMVKYNFESKDVSKYTTVSIRLKGDRKNYQFRIKDKAYNNHAYVKSFETSGDWETIKIPLKDMYPTLRGRLLDMPNFDKLYCEEIGFLIGNKKADTFKLEIKSIIISG